MALEALPLRIGKIAWIISTHLSSLSYEVTFAISKTRSRDSRKLNCSREDSVKNITPPYTLNEREHLRLVTRLRIWGRSSESFARERDRGGRARLVTRACDTWPGGGRPLALRPFERLLPI